MPAAPETTWQTACYNPDAHLSRHVARPRSNQGPTISMAGVIMGAPTTSHWLTAYPNGESIYVVQLRNAEARAALNGKVKPLRSRKPRRDLPAARPEAA